MERDWNLFYARWVIDDGEPELHVGDEFEWFAISIWSALSLIRSPKETRSAVPMAEGRYRVNAEVIYISPDPKQLAFIVDFGIRAVCDGMKLPYGCETGDYLSGEVELSLPLCTALHTHDLSQRWRINKIFADLTPFHFDSVHRVYVRNKSQTLYQEVAGTDSVKAHSYLLNCVNLTT